MRLFILFRVGLELVRILQMDIHLKYLYSSSLQR